MDDNKLKKERKGEEEMWKMEWADMSLHNTVFITFLHNDNIAARMKNVSDESFENMICDMLKEKESIEMLQAYLHYDDEGRIADGFVCFPPSPSGEDVFHCFFYILNFVIFFFFFYIIRMLKRHFPFY
jgi:hypothetical protein